MKYYVSCGDVKVVISRADIQTPLDAACEVFLSRDKKDWSYLLSSGQIWDYVIVTETGFDSSVGGLLFFTDFVLDKAGIPYE
jgi:hypothetical protein